MKYLFLMAICLAFTGCLRDMPGINCYCKSENFRLIREAERKKRERVTRINAEKELLKKENAWKSPDKIRIKIERERINNLKEKRINNNSIGMKFVLVELGTFQMGINRGKPTHSVTLTKPFAMGKYEVTQSEYKKITGNNPSKYDKGNDRPVTNVSWNDAIKFCKKITEQEHKAGILPSGATYRLPTEAEWEYCARGGNKSRGYKYSGSGSLDTVAWYNGNSGDKKHSVGKLQANELGLYDMSGNVWEWCSDLHDIYPSESVTDPVGALSGDYRIFRGGSTSSIAGYCSSVRRNHNIPTRRAHTLGFRIVLGFNDSSFSEIR